MNKQLPPRYRMPRKRVYFVACANGALTRGPFLKYEEARRQLAWKTSGAVSMARVAECSKHKHRVVAYDRAFMEAAK